MKNNKISVEDIKNAIKNFEEVAGEKPAINKNIYFFSQKMIDINPECFIPNPNGTYKFIDGTLVGILPDSMSLNEQGDELVYIIPIDDDKPIKFCFVGEKE